MAILTQQQMKYAKSWLSECFPNEDDTEEIWKLDEKGVAQSVNRYCEGGVHGFDWGESNEVNRQIADSLIETYSLRNKSQAPMEQVK